MWKAHAASLGLPWFLCAYWVNEDTAAPVCVANFSVSCAGTPEKCLCVMMASPSFIGLKENGIFTLWQTKKRSFGNLAACGFLSYTASTPAVLLSSSDIPKIEYHSICRVPTMFRGPMPCQAFCVPLSPYHSTYMYVSRDLWKYLSFSPLLLICFDQVKRCLGSVWDDWLAGETGQLSGELLQQFVITQISSSPQCHKTYRSLNLGGISSLLNFLTSTFRSCVGDKLLRCTPTQTQNVLTMSDVSVVYIDSNHLFLAQKQVHLSNFIINQVLSFCLLHYLWKDNVVDI